MKNKKINKTGSKRGSKSGLLPSSYQSLTDDGKVQVNAAFLAYNQKKDRENKHTGIYGKFFLDWERGGSQKHNKHNLIRVCYFIEIKKGHIVSVFSAFSASPAV